MEQENKTFSDPDTEYVVDMSDASSDNEDIFTGPIGFEDDTEEEIVLDPDLGENITFDEMVKQAEQNLDSVDENLVITEEDVAKEIRDNEDILDDFNISRDGLIQVLDVVKRRQNKEKFNVFRALPKEVQDRINQYVVDGGYQLNTIDGNTLRNDVSEMLIDEFINNISLNHYVAEFEDSMAELENKINEEFSKMYKDYSENRTKYIEQIMEDQEDPEKKEAIGAILDSINDGFALERIKKAAAEHKIKIKNYDLENPRREFDRFLFKYNNSTQNIYSIYMAYNTLYNHMKDKIDDDKDIIRFFVAIAKYCLNYDPKVPTEHAFMYYAMYNPILLDVYKGDDYTDFAEAYEANVKEVIDLLKVRVEPPAPNPNKTKKKKKKK